MGDYSSNADDWEEKFMRWRSSKSRSIENFQVNDIEKTIKKALKEPRYPVRSPFGTPFKSIKYYAEELKKMQSNINPKIKIAITVLAYLIPLIIFTSILTYIFQPFGFESKAYTIEIGKSGDTNYNKPFYLEESSAKRALSAPITDAETSYRELISSRPFNIIFKPDIAIPDTAQAALQLEFEGKNSDIYINSQLVFPGLLNYSILKSFNDQEIYIKNELLPYVKSSDESAANAKDFLINNFPGSTVYSTSEIELENPSLEKIDNYSRTQTAINTTFRGPIALAVYAEDLNIQFTKQDLNWYEGEDAYTLTVKDLNKNIVFTQIYQDDGNQINDSVLGNEQQFEINLENQTPKGIYFLEFQPDKNNKAVDETLTSIHVNTNKIMILGNFLPWQPVKFYVRNNFPILLNFNYWWSSKDQKIMISGDDYSSIDLNQSYLGIRYPFILYPQSHYLDFEKGYLWIYSTFAFSPNKQNYFNLPLIIQEAKNNPDFIIIDKTLLQDNKIILSQNIMINKEGNSTQIRLVNSETTKFLKAKLSIQ